MVALLKKIVAVYWPNEYAVEAPHRVGEYCADYEPLTPEEMAATDDAVVELLKYSKPISTQTNCKPIPR